MYKRCDQLPGQNTNIVEFLFSLHSLVPFGFPPIHDGIYQRFWLLPIDVCKSQNQLIEIGINPYSTNLFEIVIVVCSPTHALVDFVIGLHNKLRLLLAQGHLDELLADLVEEVMKGVFPHRFLLLAMS